MGFSKGCMYNSFTSLVNLSMLISLLLKMLSVTHCNNPCWQELARMMGVAISLNLPAPPDQVNFILPRRTESYQDFNILDQHFLTNLE